MSVYNIVQNLSDHVKELLNLYGGRVSLSLTGGADTRNILAIMLKNGVRPHLYTYGNPLSTDCLRASAIAKGLRLDHDVHDIKMTPELFADYGKKIINWGQSLSSIHRAHRIIAVEREAESCDVMYLGTLGGELVRGVGNDDNIVADFITDDWDRDFFEQSLVIQWLNKMDISIENLPLAQITQMLNNDSCCNGNAIKRKMAFQSIITAHLHDAQDLILYQNPLRFVFTPFLDYDYLKTLFSSRFSFNKKEVIKNPIKRRVVNPIYASNFIKTAYPALGRFEYAGVHKPDEINLNPYYGALRREIRKINRKKDPANFPLDNWMQQFVQRELSGPLNESPIAQYFDLKAMNSQLKKGEYIPIESFWLKYTNPIMMDYILKYI